MHKAHAWVWQTCVWPHGWDLPALAGTTQAWQEGLYPWSSLPCVLGPSPCQDLPCLLVGWRFPKQPPASAEHPEGRGGARCSASSSCHARGSKGPLRGEKSGSKTSGAGAWAKPWHQTQADQGIVARVPTSHGAPWAAVSRVATTRPAGPSPSSCWVSTRSLIWESKLQSGRPLLKEVSEIRDVRKFHYVSCSHVRSRSVFFQITTQTTQRRDELQMTHGAHCL